MIRSLSPYIIVSAVLIGIGVYAGTAFLIGVLVGLVALSVYGVLVAAARRRRRGGAS